jgi:transketolase
MRRAFAETLAELAQEDPRIVLLTADLGFMALEPFADVFPDRFFNVGVAEQNMVGIATGLAEAGLIPFVYSIVTFAVLRPFEFIRNGPIAHRLPVRIVSVGGGLEYGHNGISHYGLEDVAIMRTQPAISVVCPSDGAQTRTAVRSTWTHPGPIYYRLGKDDTIVVPGLDGRFEFGRAQIVHEGVDVLIIVMGAISIEAVKAANALKSRGVEATVMLVSSFNPAPVEDVVDQLRRFKVVITLEAHYATGGLGSWISEVTAEYGLGCRIICFGIKDFPSGASGSQSYLQGIYGISSESVVEAALEACGH